MNPPDGDNRELESEVGSANGGLTKLVVLLAIGVVVLLVLNSTALGSGRSGDLKLMLDQFAAQGINQKLGFMLLTTFLVFAGMPRLLFFGLGGWLMGFTEGFLCAMLASLMGSYLSFRLMRWAGREWITRRFSGKRLVGKIIAIEPKVMPVMMVRQLPVSNGILNACLAMSRVKDHTFLLGSLLGFVPQGIAAGLICSGSAKGRLSGGLANLGAATTVIAAIALWTYWQRTKRSEPQPLPANTAE